MKTILAIDGGRIRGIIPALLLQEIEKRTTLHISDLFDVIAGSSTGGILAATREKYYRLQLKLPKHLAKFDNVSDANVTQLAEQASKFIKENDELINEICRNLILAHVKRRIGKKNV